MSDVARALLNDSVQPMTDQIMANRQKSWPDKLGEVFGYQNGQWQAPGIADFLSAASMAIPGAKFMPRSAAPMRAYHRSANDFGAFDLAKSNTGNAFGKAAYFAPEPNPGYGPKTYEAQLSGKPLSINVNDPAEVAAFNKQFKTSLQQGGYFENFKDQQQLPDVLRQAGFDRLEIKNGEKVLETAVFNPETIEILRKYGIIGLLGGGAYQPEAQPQ